MGQVILYLDRYVMGIHYNKELHNWKQSDILSTRIRTADCTYYMGYYVFGMIKTAHRNTEIYQ